MCTSQKDVDPRDTQGDHETIKMSKITGWGGKEDQSLSVACSILSHGFPNCMRACLIDTIACKVGHDQIAYTFVPGTQSSDLEAKNQP